MWRKGRWGLVREASGGQLGLDLLHDAGKSRFVVNGDVGQHLAIQTQPGLVQPVDELAVGQAQRACGGVDAGNRIELS